MQKEPNTIALPTPEAMSASEIYRRQLATKEQIESEISRFFFHRIFNDESFVSVDSTPSDPKDMLPSLLPLTDVMTIKVALKESLRGDNIGYDNFRDVQELCALERSSGVEISPFDFVDYRSSWLAGLLNNWTSSLYQGLGPYAPSEKQCRRFEAFVKRARKSSFKKTRFAYNEIFND